MYNRVETRTRQVRRSYESHSTPTIDFIFSETVGKSTVRSWSHHETPLDPAKRCPSNRPDQQSWHLPARKSLKRLCESRIKRTTLPQAQISTTGGFAYRDTKLIRRQGELESDGLQLYFVMSEVKPKTCDRSITYFVNL